MSKLKEMKNNSFPNATIKEWETQAEKALKGKPVSKLYSSTYEEITRKPIYTEEDLENIKMPIINADWVVAQKLYGTDSLEEVNLQLKQELKNGLCAIHFSTYPASDKDALQITDKKDFEALFHEIPFADYPIHVYAGANAVPFINALMDSSIDTSKLHGYIGVDPIGELAATGQLIESFEQLYESMKMNIEWKQNNAPALKTILVQTAPYHNGGANAVQELGASMATAVEYLQALLEKGFSVEEAANEMAFSFPIGSDFFMELAKLRAARILWTNVIEAFGGSEDIPQPTIHATTSAFNKSSLDPYVNMLRTTTEAFSAAIAGADSLNVDSYQQGNDPFSRRIARNTHYILKEESFLSKVSDPAAGSYYVESLTQSLAAEAWKLFQEIEKLGGIVKALESNLLQDKIEAVKQKRFKDAQSRKKVLIGTNMYANLNEELKERGFSKIIDRSEVYPSVKVNAIPQVRLTASYEALRYQAKAFEKNTGSKPMVTLVNLGALASHKPRTDFASGFFQVGGLFPVQSPSIKDVQELKAWLSEENPEHYVCICGSDDTYSEMLSEAIAVLNQHNCKLLVAGLPDATRQEELKRLGVADFIHLRSNCYQQLSTIHQEMGLREYEA